jgi:hypothetical protein
MSSSGVDLNLDLMIGQQAVTGETPSLTGQSMGLLLALTYTN